MPTLHDILQSTSSALFPAELGHREVFLDSRDSDGDTALHVVLRRKDARAAAVLIEAGANVNAVGDLGRTPLHIAVRSQMAETVALLVQAGARPDVRDEFGVSARELALEIGGEVARAVKGRRHG
jgi:ankyrin repeat protein